MTSRQRLMLAVTHKHVCASQTVRLLVRRYQRQTAARWMGAVRKGEREQACTARVAEGWYFRHGVRARHNGSTLAVSLVGTCGLCWGRGRELYFLAMSDGGSETSLLSEGALGLCQTGDGEGRLSCTGQEEARSPMCARGEGDEQQEEDLLGKARIGCHDEES